MASEQESNSRAEVAPYNPVINVQLEDVDGSSTYHTVDWLSLQSFEVRSRGNYFLHICWLLTCPFLTQSFYRALTCSVPRNLLRIVIDFGDGSVKEFSHGSWLSRTVWLCALEISVHVEIRPSMCVFFNDLPRFGVNVAPFRVQYLGRTLWSILDEAEGYLRSNGVAEEIIANNFYMVSEGTDSGNVTSGDSIICLLGSFVAEANSEDGVDLGQSESVCQIVPLERDEGAENS